MRLRAGWAREELDRRLAEGADPGTDPLLKARAERLVAPASRATFAAGLERVVATVHEPAASLSSAVPVRRGPLAGARHELMGLAGELRHMPDPRPRGVAMAGRLLTEPSSVLFTASASAVGRTALTPPPSTRPARGDGVRNGRRGGGVPEVFRGDPTTSAPENAKVSD
jgi:hypothetical protein